MKYIENLKFVLIILIFIIGLLFYIKYSGGRLQEGFQNKRCPNVLIQKENEFLLFNSNLAPVPGVNPISFKNLEDYKEFIDWQRSQGINCPVLFLQQSFDAQGNEVIQNRPDPFDLQGGLQTIPLNENDLENISLLYDAGRNDAPYNQNHYPSFDPHNQYIGLHTPLDQMNENEKKKKISDNPMDTNWGGTGYTQQLVARGHYAGREVYKPSHKNKNAMDIKEISKNY